MDYSVAESFDHWSRFEATWSSVQSFGDQEFYRGAVEKYGRPAVELGVGYGRVAEHTTPDAGVDISEISLELCRKRCGDSLKLIHADLRTYQLPDRANFSYAPLNTFNHVLESEQRIEAFANILENTRSGGVFIFDSYVLPVDIRVARDKIIQHAAKTHDRALYTSEAIIDRENWISEVTAFEEELDPDGIVVRRRVIPGPRRAYVQPHQFATELSRAGWIVKSLAGDFHGNPLVEPISKQVWTAVAP